jgi:hypothetical protein
MGLGDSEGFYEADRRDAAVAKATRAIVGKARVTTETKQDQINYYCPSSSHPVDAIKDAYWMETLINNEQPLPSSI